MTAPAVSFVVPARNEVGYLEDALSSTEAQATDRRYEVIVADGLLSRDAGREFGPPGRRIGAVGDAVSLPPPGRRPPAVESRRSRGADTRTGTGTDAE